MIKLIKPLLILTLVLSLVVYFIYLSGLILAFPVSYLFFANVYFALLTFIVGTVSLIGIESSKQQIFIKTIGFGTFLRLFFSLVFLAIYLIFSENISWVFFIGFMLLYFIYTIFEIKFLVANLRPDSESPTNV